MTTNNPGDKGIRPRGARLTPRTVRTPSSPVPKKPSTESGGIKDKQASMKRSEPKATGHCFVDEDHSSYSAQELELFPTEVQLPNSSVKAKVMVCLHHKVEMDELKEHGLGAARKLAVAPYGRCYVCDDPLGLRDEETRLPDQPGEQVPVNFWERMDKPEDVVHVRCRPAYRAKVVDEDGNESKPGWSKRIVMV